MFSKSHLTLFSVACGTVSLMFAGATARKHGSGKFEEFTKKAHHKNHDDSSPVDTTEGVDFLDQPCLKCTALFATVDNFLNDPVIQQELIDFSIGVCISGGLAGTPELVCPGIVTYMGDVVIEVMGQYVLTKDRICNQYLGLCPRPEFEKLTFQDFQTRVLADKPAQILNDDYTNNLYAEIRNDPNPRPTLKAVHMSDPHIDLEYKEGTLWKCGSYTCCREEWGYPSDPTLAAGKWGGYECDLPRDTLLNMLEHVKEVQQPDLFFWTGDNSAHNVWSNTNEEVTEYTLQITSAIQYTFGDDDIIVYPIQGNHDTWPVNVEDFSAPGINYPINHFKDSWTQWIGQEAIDKFGEYGYYSVPFKLPGGKVLENSKIIGFNSQTANDQNWWILGERNDPGNQIAWLEAELAETEAAGGFVYIIAHIQPYNFQIETGARFRALMERYQHVVRFQMYGHTHDQYFEVTNSVTNPYKHIGAAQIGPSVTTNTWENPGFAVIEIDEATMLPINYEIWALDIEEANRTGVPNWEKVIDYVNDYNMELGVSPDGLYDLAQRMLTDSDLARKYKWGMNRFATDEPNTFNAHSLFCMLTTSDDWEHKDCNGQKHMDFINDLAGSMFDFTISNWVQEVTSTISQMVDGGNVTI